MKRIVLFLIFFLGTLLSAEGPDFGLPGHSDLRSDNQIAHQLKKIIACFSYPEQYRPILELINALKFSLADEREVSFFLERMPSVEKLMGKSGGSLSYLFAENKLPVWIDLVLSTMLLLVNGTGTYSRVKERGAEDFSLDKAPQTILGLVGYVGAPLCLLGHAIYRLLGNDTLPRMSSYFMASEMAQFFKTTSPQMVPQGLKKWFTYYQALSLDMLVKRIKHGLLINDLGVALCVLSMHDAKS